MSRRHQPDRGLSTAVEAALLVPLVMVLVAAMVAGFRVWQARTELRQTAGAAARAASQARTADEAQRRLLQVADANPRSCSSLQAGSDLGAFSLPAGQAGEVSVTLTCRVPLADLGLPGLPGHVTVTAAGSAPLDTYRRRGR